MPAKLSEAEQSDESTTFAHPERAVSREETKEPKQMGSPRNSQSSRKPSAASWLLTNADSSSALLEAFLDEFWGVQP